METTHKRMLRLQREAAAQENLIQAEIKSKKPVSHLEKLDQITEQIKFPGPYQSLLPVKRTISSSTSLFKFEDGLDMIQYPHKFQDQALPVHQKEEEKRKFQKLELDHDDSIYQIMAAPQPQ